MRRPVVIHLLVASLGSRTNAETATERGARRERRLVVEIVADGHERLGRVLGPAEAIRSRRNGVVKDLLENVPNAEVAKPRLRGSPTTEKSVAADFVYLARATRLVVTESTYSWWAAYVGQATEIHAPGVGIVPVPADEHRYVFHDIASRRYWGRWDAAAREIRYTDVEPARRRRRRRTKSSKGDDDDDAIPMGFGVGHPSFKAAFPESASWDK